MSQPAYNAVPIPFSIDTATGTFIQKEISMPKAEGGLLPAVLKLELYLPHSALVNDKYLQFHLSIASETAIKTAENANVLISDYISCVIGAGIEDKFVKHMLEYELPAPVLVSKEKIFLGVIQDAAATLTISGKIWYVPRSVPGVVQQVSLRKQTYF